MIRSKEELKYYMDEDFHALFPNGARFLTKFKDPIYQFEKLLRKCEYYRNTAHGNPYLNPLYLVNKIQLRNLALKLGFTISENCFGPGLSIGHYGDIVVNPNAKIGSHCRIHSGVNIGADINESDVPTIGNNVYIGPGAKIFGSIVIGDNTKIGANAVVNKSFSGGGTLVGVPAKPLIKE